MCESVCVHCQDRTFVSLSMSSIMEQTLSCLCVSVSLAVCSWGQDGVSKQHIIKYVLSKVDSVCVCVCVCEIMLGYSVCFMYTT